MIRRSMILAALLTAFLAEPAAAEPRTHYALDLSERHTQVLGVTVRFEDVETDRLRVHLPVWRTGLYRLLDTVGTVSEVSVRDPSGQALPFEQTAKSTWEITRPDAMPGTVIFQYRVYAASLNDRTRDVDADHAFINPGLVLVYEESLRDAPIEITTRLPEDWRIATGLESPAYGRLVAPDYDRLVDSPIEMGTFDLVAFEAAGAVIQFAITGDWDGDAERLEADVRPIVETAARIYGDMPTDRYVFITHSAPGLGGGTEYYNSTVVHTEPERFWDEEGYENFLSLLAHEFFHLWNVKRFRPAGIARYDYLQENYTDLLWVAEGLTSYYDELLLARSGVISVEDYRERLGDNVDAVVDRPGYGRDSLAQASFEAWTKGYHQGADRGPDKANSSISFYAQGGLLGLVLDLEIRGRTGGAHSLDDVMRSLYEDFPLGSDGYTYADVRDRVELVGGGSLAEALDGWVLGTERLPIARALRNVGWTLEREEAEDDPVPTLGLRSRSADGGQRVRFVRRDGPAWRAGVNVDDVLLAVNGVRIGDDLDTLLERHAPGEPVALTLFRHGRLRTLEAVLGEALRDHEVEPGDDDDPFVAALRSDWLGGHQEDDGDD